MRWLDSITNSMNMNLSKLREIVEGQGSLTWCNSWDCKELDMTYQLKTWKISIFLGQINKLTLKLYEY